MGGGAIEPNREIDKQREIQRQTERAEEERSFKPDGDGGAMQAGARRYPEPPFPAQHQEKPGIEAIISPAPMYDAPYYKGSEKLAGKTALIVDSERRQRSHRIHGLGLNPSHALPLDRRN